MCLRLFHLAAFANLCVLAGCTDFPESEDAAADSVPDVARAADAADPDARPDDSVPADASPDGVMPDADEADSAPDIRVADGAPHDLGTDAPTPDAAQPDAAQPDAAQPDAAQPDAARPDAARPDGQPPEPDAEPPTPDAQALPPDAAPDARPDGPPPPECGRGAVERRGCGPDARGREARRCVDDRWSPWSDCDDPGGDLVAWFDASDETTLDLDEEGRVLVWGNLADPQNPASARGEAEAAPSLDLTGLAGLPALDFDGVDDALYLATNLFPRVELPSGTVIVVFETSDDDGVVVGAVGPNPQGSSAGLLVADGRLIHSERNAEGGLLLTAAAPLSGPVVASAVHGPWDAQERRLSTNGLVVARLGGAGQIDPNRPALVRTVIGLADGAGLDGRDHPLEMRLSELRIWHRTLSPEELDDQARRLAAKWDISVPPSEPASGLTPERPIAACVVLRQLDLPRPPQGPRWLDPDPDDDDDPFLAWCDSETDRGGWTLVANLVSEPPRGIPYTSGDMGDLAVNFVGSPERVETIALASVEIRFQCEANRNRIDLKTNSPLWTRRGYAVSIGCEETLDWRPELEGVFTAVGGHNYEPTPNSGSNCMRNPTPLIVEMIGFEDRDWMPAETGNWQFQCAGQGRDSAEHMRVWYR